VCACIEPNRPTARHDDATTRLLYAVRSARRAAAPTAYATFRHTARTQRRTGHPNVMSACKQVVRPSVWPRLAGLYDMHTTLSPTEVQQSIDSVHP